jgi:hypothetical protein
MKNDIYIVHHCKNSKKQEFIQTKDKDGKIISKISNPEYCNNCFIDVDKTGATTHPPTWKYCPECVEKGYKNPKTRNVTKTPEQIELFKQRMKEYRESKAL